MSVLASCETEEEVRLARSPGYATAMVVEEHPGDRRHRKGRVNLASRSIADARHHLRHLAAVHR